MNNLTLLIKRNKPTKFIRDVIFVFCFLFFVLPIGRNVNAADVSRTQKFRNDAYIAFNAIYHFKFASADSLITKIKYDYPEMCGSYLLAANYYWWEIITGNDSKINRAQFLLNLDVANKKTAKIYASSTNEEIYSIINIYAFRARYEAMHDNYISALTNINSCVGVLKKSFGKELVYEPFNLTSGIYNYTICKTNEDHILLRPYTLFLPSGNKTTGLAMLEKTAHSKDPVLSTEANYFLFKIYIDDEKEFPKAGVHINWLIENYPSNLLYQYFYITFLLKSGRLQDAQKRFPLITTLAASNPEITEMQRRYFLDLISKELKKPAK